VGLLGAVQAIRWAARRAIIDGTRSALKVDSNLIADHLGRAAPKLHIGCGPHELEGWLNCDLATESRNVLRLDATKLFPFPSDGFDYIFSEHMIEHVTFPEGMAMLKECFRVLKPGGRIRLSTPDLKFLINLYSEHRTELEQRYMDAATPGWAPCAEPGFVINNFVRDWGHQFIYDEATLRRALTDVGFAQITAHRLQKSDHVALRGLENEGRQAPGFVQLESFTLEASKP
jgi:predicted SAM-dependent methyltransferase